VAPELASKCTVQMDDYGPFPLCMIHKIECTPDLGHPPLVMPGGFVHFFVMLSGVNLMFSAIRIEIVQATLPVTTSNEPTLALLDLAR